MNATAQPTTQPQTNSKPEELKTFKAEIEVETAEQGIEVIEDEIEAKNLKTATSKARGKADMRNLNQIGRFTIKNVYKVEVSK